MSSDVLGIDVSQYQAGDISRLLVGKSFAAARASIGTHKDTTYDVHAREIQQAKLPLIAYHYLIPPGPGDGTQSKAFLNAISRYHPDIAALDVERSALNFPRVAEGWIALVRKAFGGSMKILLYSSEGTWPGNLGQDGNWVANWSQEPRIPYRFWQYSNSGNRLDLDRWHGTLAELHAWI